MTSLLEYACTEPGCDRAFASEHGRTIHRATHHKREAEPGPVHRDAGTSEARCRKGRFCRRARGHAGRCYPNSAGEATATPRERRKRATVARTPAPAPGPAVPPIPAGRSVRVVVVRDGVLRLAASELGELSAVVEIGGVRFRISSAGETLELVPEETS